MRRKGRCFRKVVSPEGMVGSEVGEVMVGGCVSTLGGGCSWVPRTRMMMKCWRYPRQGVTA